ncbi:hypothetical protein HPP92_022185 [Vanilla planifolia]|uniref:Uncharacterized protein n=1 Tax=Vanilla planifolia TaxID=51239 RepID=A0A835UDA2_VANPL|nr:hypothetical protein HPP92_022185 [Vanilla planifolia]
MEPMAFAFDRIIAFGTSTERFVKGMLQSWHKRSSQTPIEILKRLQREVFSDLMKLRDRQDKIERMFTLYQSGRGSPFQEASTRVKGIVNADGALMFVENDYLQACNNLNRVGTRRGIDLRFIFETPIRPGELLLAEFLASQTRLVNHGDVNCSPVVLAKLVYLANISDWLSAVFIPSGAECNDFGVLNFHQGYSGNHSTSFSPPLFHQRQSCGIGLMFKESKVACSVAGLASKLGSVVEGVGDMGLSTFWQVSYKPSEDTRLAMSSIWQVRKPSHLLKLGPIAFPNGFKNKVEIINECREASSSTSPRKVGDNVAAATIAVMLESQFDECTNLDCWIEMWKSSPSSFKWGLALSDTPQDQLGWGLKVGGEVEGHLRQFWMEGFLNCYLGKKAVLQPGLVYALNGNCRTPALVLRSSWFM